MWNGPSEQQCFRWELVLVFSTVGYLVVASGTWWYLFVPSRYLPLSRIKLKTCVPSDATSATWGESDRTENHATTFHSSDYCPCAAKRIVHTENRNCIMFWGDIRKFFIAQSLFQCGRWHFSVVFFLAFQPICFRGNCNYASLFVQ